MAVTFGQRRACALPKTPLVKIDSCCTHLKDPGAVIQRALNIAISLAVHWKEEP